MPRSALVGLIPIVACFGMSLSNCGSNGENHKLTVMEVTTETIPPAGVRVVFSVRNEQDEPVAGLTIENLELLADGQPLEDEGVPSPLLAVDPDAEHSVLILLDLSSGLVASDLLQPQLDAALRLAEALLPDSNVALAIYAGPTHFSIEVPLTSDISALNAGIEALQNSEGLGTRDLYGSILQSLEELTTASQGITAVRSLVFFTGGSDQALAVSEDSVEAAINEATEQGTQVYGISLGDTIDRDLLNRLAPSGVEISKSNDDLPAIASRVASEVVQVMSGRYVLAFCSPRVSGERQLKLIVSKDGAQGDLEISYNADGFDMVGCDPAVIADPCSGRQCGIFMGRSCGTCADSTPYCNSRWRCSPTPSCPGDMVMIASLMVCIDLYEASEDTGGFLRSVAGAIPWSEVSQEQAAEACASVGKRLCTQDEWISACEGTDGDVYPYGPSCSPGRCNSSAAGASHALPTGSLPECEGGYPGLFDMAGNLREWTDSCDGSLCRAVGGSFDDEDCMMTCASSTEINPHLNDQRTGFRCCVSL